MMSAKKPPADEPPQGYDTPAKFMPDHFIVNPDDPERWRRYGVRDDHPLVRAYERGQLASGHRGYTPEDRFGAGTLYRGVYAEVHGSGMAKSNLVRVSGSGNQERASDRLCASRALLRKINVTMQGDNAFIVQAICGEGHHFSEAVRERNAGFEKAVYPRVCVALDDLIDTLLTLGLHRVQR